MHFFALLIIGDEEHWLQDNRLYRRSGHEQYSLRLEEVIEDILQPYCEELEVEPYQEECWCSKSLECDRCHGSGMAWTACNPRGRWDWYQIGGRWSKEIIHQEGDTRAEEQTPTCSALEDNVIRMELMSSNIVFHTIITPDREWHDESKEAGRAWVEKSETLIKRYSKGGYIGVGIDYHS